MSDEKKDWRERFDEIFGEVSKKDAELVDMLEPCPHMPCSGAVKDFIAAEIAAAEDRVRAEEAKKYEAGMSMCEKTVEAACTVVENVCAYLETLSSPPVDLIAICRDKAKGWKGK